MHDDPDITTSPDIELTLSITIMVRLFPRDKVTSLTTAAAVLTPFVSTVSEVTFRSYEEISGGNRNWDRTFTLYFSSPSPDCQVVHTDYTLTPQPAPLTNMSASDDGYERSAVVHTLWVSIIILGALGNGLVIYTMGRHGERSATNVYILNLALSDFAVLTILVPFTITMFTSFEWQYGETMCKATVYLIYVTLQATCLTLTAMTIDRYFAIVHPITSLRDRTPRAAVIISITTWLTSLFICVPFIVYSHLVYRTERSGTHVYCVNEWPTHTVRQVVTIAFVLSTYVMPLSVIIVCYTLILKHLWRNKIGVRRELPGQSSHEGGQINLGPVPRRRRKVTKMVFAVVLIFAVTWFPIHVFNLCFVLMTHFPKTAALYNVKIFCHTLSYLNSCLNPFVYAFLGDGFRRAFRRSFPRCTQRNQVLPSINQDPGPCTTAESRLAGITSSATSRERTRNAFETYSDMPPDNN